MDILFIDERNKLQFNPSIIHIEAFKALWLKDESAKKTLFMKQMSYVWFFCDFASPYVKQGLNEDDKDEAIREDLGFKGPLLNRKLIDAAIDKYVELNSTETLRLLQGAQHAIESIRTYYMDLDMSEKDSKGGLVNNVSQVINSLKGIGSLNKDLKVLKKEVLSEMAQSGHIKGGGEKGMFEDPE